MMKMKLARVALALVGGGGLATGVVLATAGTAGATYGKGADYQVEISANPPGEGVWFWSELMTMTGTKMGTYQETDCLHLGGGHTTDAAAHDAGTLTWSVTSTSDTLVMAGVQVIGGLETVTVTVPLPTSGFGKVSSVTFTPTSGLPLLTGTLPAQVEIAP